MELFLLFFKTSFSASFLIAAIFIIRLFIKKLPCIYSYLLWSFVLFRLLCPLFLQIEGFEPVSRYIESLSDTAMERNYDNNQSPLTNLPQRQMEGFQRKVEEPALVLARPQSHKKINLEIIWLSGMTLFGFLSIIQTVAVYRLVKNSERLYDNIFISNRIVSPFVLGLLQPNIYLPSNITDRTYIIAHEKIHIKRKDNIIKLLFWVAVIVHWYNPMVWLAFCAMENDMEMSCDEQVMQHCSEEIRVLYSSQLLKATAGRNSLILPVQFNRGGTIRRFKNIFQIKKAPKGIVTASIFIVALSLTTGCMVTGKAASETKPDTTSLTNGQTAETNGTGSGQIAAPAVWSMNTMLDTEIPDLDYASDDRVIFHGYFGLFVYDLQTKQLIASLNLKDLGCQKVQTGGSCRVLVSEDGTMVYLYPYEKDYMYLFNISENTMEQTAAAEPVSYFKGLLKSRDVLGKAETKIHLCSANAVPFHDGSYGYLYINGGSLSDVVYQRAGKSQDLLTKKDNPAPILLRQDDSYYQAYQIKANESYGSFIDSYLTMYALNDYAGICSLSTSLEYSDEMQKQWQGYRDSIAWGEELKTTENRSCYKFMLLPSGNRGEAQKEKYLYIKKNDVGWYADGLPQNNPPDDSWWINDGV